MTEPDLLYNPETGIFTWLKPGPGRGIRAGSSTGHGYRKICINGIKYYEHHLAWYSIHGEWPKEVDHINNNGHDNRLCNLRLCTRTQNNYNTCIPTGESGLRGAYLDKRVSKWYSKIQLGGRVKYLGTFNTAEEAHNAFMAEWQLHAGEYAHHTRKP